MKLRSALALLIVFAALGAEPGRPNIAAAFDYDFTNTKICSTAITANCLSHFEVGILTAGAFNTMASLPMPEGANGPMKGLVVSWRNSYGYGSHIIAAITVAKDGQGNRITSDPAKATVSAVLPPPPPSLISLTVD